jgi:hypothetical protein
VAIRVEAESDHQSFAPGFFLFLGVSHIPEVRTEAPLRQ